MSKKNSYPNYDSDVAVKQPKKKKEKKEKAEKAKAAKIARDQKMREQKQAAAQARTNKERV